MFMGNYIPLMEEFYDEFKNKNNLPKIIRKYLIICCISIILITCFNIVAFFVSKTIKTILNSILVFLFIILMLFTIICWANQQ